MPDERTLICDAQQGDHEAFRKLVENARVNVYRLAYDLTSDRHDAEDLSQEVFIKAYRALRTFRGDAKWNSWLYRITVNTFYDLARSRMNKMINYSNNWDQDSGEREILKQGNSISPDASAEAAIIQKHIEQALDRLSPRERSVFVLRHYHDLTLKQIADTLEISDGTVKTFLFRAIQKLQQALACYRNEFGVKRI
jgi:RNA polymerase sigma-70 factor, ECF subfamily